MDGNLKKVLKRITMVGTVIAYGLILLLEFKLYLNILDRTIVRKSFFPPFPVFRNNRFRIFFCLLLSAASNLYLENIKQWKNQITEEKQELSKEQIMEQLKRMEKELKPEIGVATVMDGNLIHIPERKHV